MAYFEIITLADYSAIGTFTPDYRNVVLEVSI